jgi:hypothetical protein
MYSRHGGGLAAAAADAADDDGDGDEGKEDGNIAVTCVKAVSQLLDLSARKAKQGPMAFKEPRLSLAEGPISKLPPLNTDTLLLDAADADAAAAADEVDPVLIVAASPCISKCTYIPSSSD